MPLIVHYWADLQSVHKLRCYGNTRNAWRSSAVIRQAHRTPHALSIRRRLPSNRRACCVRDVICNEAVPFRPYCGGVVTRTRNVSENMLVLSLCLVVISVFCDGTCRYGILAPFSRCRQILWHST